MNPKENVRSRIARAWAEIKTGKARKMTKARFLDELAAW